MALNANQIPVYAITPKTSVGILNAATAGTLGTTTNAVTILTASASGSVVDSLFFNSDDTAAVNVFLFIVGSDGTTVKPLGIINVPLSSGNAANVLNVDGLNPNILKGLSLDNTGKYVIRLGASETLRMSCLANMTAAKKLYATAQFADYV
jgi:hypothetical protein